MDGNEKKSASRQSKAGVRVKKEKIKHEVVQLHLQGLNGIEVSQYFMETQGIRVHKNMIAKIMKEAHNEFVQQKNEAIENLKTRELAKINNLEKTYWQAWVRSCGQITETRTEQTRTGKKKKAQEPVLDISKIAEYKKMKLGDSRFLDGVQWCIDKRCQLLGLEAPVKPIDTGSGNTTINYIRKVTFAVKTA